MLCRLCRTARSRRVGCQAALIQPARSALVTRRWNASLASEAKGEPAKPKRRSRTKSSTTIAFDDLPAFKTDADGLSVGPLEDLLELGKGYKEGEVVHRLQC